jgi:hypothetical protein
MKLFRNLGSQINVSLRTDENGYLGRECPNAECKGYFKTTPGTGLSGVSHCCCPYCGHKADQSEFTTRDQMEYAKSVAIRQVKDAFVKDLKNLEFDTKPKGMFGIGLSMKVEAGQPHPIHWYREKALETHIECAACSLRYAVFGVFAFCPDCGGRNSLQIHDKNLDVAVKMLDMAAAAEADIATRLTENALEDCISAFDAFGRETCRVSSKKLRDSPQAENLSFQNLEGARQKVSVLFNVDFSAGLTRDEWQAAVRGFQRRHLLSHKMGVVDEEYVRKSGDMHAVLGRKIRITAAEVRDLVLILRKLAHDLVNILQ